MKTLELPYGVTDVVIAADDDDAGRSSAAALAQRLASIGLGVTTANAGGNRDRV
jgi:hypothetical protein